MERQPHLRRVVNPPRVLRVKIFTFTTVTITIIDSNEQALKGTARKIKKIRRTLDQAVLVGSTHAITIRRWRRRSGR